MSKQLPLFQAVGDSDKVSPTNAVGDTKKQAIERFLARGNEKVDQPSICIKKYKPNSRKTEYFRLDYRVKNRVRSIHIPGGNVHANLAQYRVKELQAMINRSAELGEIIAAVQDYRNGKAIDI